MLSVANNPNMLNVVMLSVVAPKLGGVFNPKTISHSSLTISGNGLPYSPNISLTGKKLSRDKRSSLSCRSVSAEEKKIFEIET
jgi:hypothetical protein